MSASRHSIAKAPRPAASRQAGREAARSQRWQPTSKILHPWREHVAENAFRFIKIEFRRVLPGLHDRRFPARRSVHHRQPDGLKTPRLSFYGEPYGARQFHVQAIGDCCKCYRHGPHSQRLHQMRSDLGRLDAAAEILQVGSLLGLRA